MGVAIYVGIVLFSSEAIGNEDILSLLSIPGGLLMCWGVYHLLKRNWAREKEIINSDILDDGF